MKWIKVLNTLKVNKYCCPKLLVMDNFEPVQYFDLMFLLLKLNR